MSSRREACVIFFKCLQSIHRARRRIHTVKAAEAPCLKPVLHRAFHGSSGNALCVTRLRLFRRLPFSRRRLARRESASIFVTSVEMENRTFSRTHRDTATLAITTGRMDNSSSRLLPRILSHSRERDAQEGTKGDCAVVKNRAFPPDAQNEPLVITNRTPPFPSRRCVPRKLPYARIRPCINVDLYIRALARARTRYMRDRCVGERFAAWLVDGTVR